MPTKRRSEAIWIESKAYWQIKVQKDDVRKAFTSAVKGRKGKHEAEPKQINGLKKVRKICFFRRHGKNF